MFACLQVCHTEDGYTAPLANKIFDDLSKAEAKSWYLMQATLGDDPKPLNTRKPEQSDPIDQKDALKKAKLFG